MRNLRRYLSVPAIAIAMVVSSVSLASPAVAAPLAPHVVSYELSAHVADDNGTTAHINLYWQGFDMGTPVEVRTQAGIVPPAAAGGQVLFAGVGGQTWTVAVASKTAWSFRIAGLINGQAITRTVVVGHVAISWAVAPDRRPGYEAMKVTGRVLLNGVAPGLSVPLHFRCRDAKNVNVSLDTTKTGAFSGSLWLTSAMHCFVATDGVQAYPGAPGFFPASTGPRLVRGRVFFNSGGTIENFVLSSGTTSVWTRYYLKNAPRNTPVSVQVRSGGAWRTVATVRSGAVVKGFGSQVRFTVRVSSKRGSTFTFRLFTPATAATFAEYEVVSRPVF